MVELVRDVLVKLEGEAREEYHAMFAGLDPVEHVARMGDGVFFQWGGQDTFVGEGGRAAYARANPQARTQVYERAEHILDDQALADLRGFLHNRLGLDQN